MQSAAKTYFQTQVTTTTQGDLLIMLFDAALKFLRQAKEKIEEKNYAEKGILISKALDILAELQGSLNAKKGGDLADRLQKLYFFCSTRLLAANLKMDTGKIDEVMQILDGLRDAFNEVNSRVATKAVPTTASHGSMSRPSTISGTHAKVSPISTPLAQSVYRTQAGLPNLQTPAATAEAPKQPQPAPQPPVTDVKQAATECQVNAVPPLADKAAAFDSQDHEMNPSAANTTPVRRIMAAYAASRPQEEGNPHTS